MNFFKQIFTTLKTSLIASFKLTKTFITEDEQKKLLSFNEFISNKQVIIGVCVIISLLFLVIFNILSQLISNLGHILKGNFNYLKIFVPNFGATPFFIIGLLILFICLFILVYKIKVNFKDLNVGQKGKARFATLEEIKATYLKIPEKNIFYIGDGGFPMSRYEKDIYIDQRNVNRLTFTITRGGKGEVFVIPSIETYSRATNQPSLILFDLKMELARATIQMLLDRNYKIKLLNLIDTDHSIGFNPLQLILDFWLKGDYANAEQSAKTVAKSIVGTSTKEAYWDNTSTSLLVAVIFAHIEDLVKSNELEKINLYSVTIFINTLGKIKDKQKKESKLDEFFNSRSIWDRARLKYSAIDFAETKGKASILSVLVDKLEIFTYDEIARITSYNTIDLLDIGFNEQNPTAVFIATSPATDVYNLIVSLFTSQVYFINMTMAVYENCNKFKRKIRVIADEICNYPAIDNIETMISLGLSTGWGFDFYVQEIEQFKIKYDEKIVDTIIGNCATQIYLLSSSEKTREHFIKNLGSKTIKTVSRSGERLSLSKNITENYDSETLLTDNAMTKFVQGECIVLPYMSRDTLDGKKTPQFPIHNHNETEFKLRYEYLPELDPMSPIDYEKIGAVTRQIFLKDIVYIPFINGVLPIDIDEFKQTPPKQKQIESDEDEMEDIKESKNLLVDKINQIQFSMFKKVLSASKIEIENDINCNTAKELLTHSHRNGDIKTEDYTILIKMLD